MTELTIRDAAASDRSTFAKLVHDLGVDAPVPMLERFDGEMLRTMLIAERERHAVGDAFFRPRKDVVHLVRPVSAPEADATKEPGRIEDATDGGPRTT